MKNYQNALKPDAQGFDEVRIITVPRYKNSGLSGSEWRISAKIQLVRKGKVIKEISMGNVEHAVNGLGFILMQANDEGLAYFGGGEDGKCDQEGCSSKATIFYRVKKEYCKDHPHDHPAKALKDEIRIRQFCEEHKTRGDCAFDDADANYEFIDL